MRKRNIVLPATVLSIALTFAGSITVLADETFDAGEFSFSYSSDWNFNPEEDMYSGSNNVNATPWIPKEEGEGKAAYITISVKKDGRDNYTNDMHSAGFEAMDEVLNQSYEKTNIGGIDFVANNKTYWGKYMAYDDEKNAYISIYISTNPEDERVTELLKSITFNLKEYTDKNTPWYWDGTPYSVADHTITVGDYTLTSKQIKLEPSEHTYDIFGSRVGAVGNDVYILSDSKLQKYTREGDVLINPETVDLPFEADEFAVDQNGIMYISSFMNDLTAISEGVQTVISTETDYVAVHPNGSMGVSWFSGADIDIVNTENGAITTKTVPGLSSVSHVFMTENHIMLSGRNEAKDGSCLQILDINGEQVAEINAENTTTGYYGSVSTVAETSAGLMIFDGNMRDIYFTDTNGELFASIDMRDLLGTGYPWPSSAITTSDGKILLCLTDERQDRSCDETLLFEISGFGDAASGETVIQDTPALEETESEEPEQETAVIDYSSTEVIQAVQNALNAAGYDCGVADGIAGSKTYGALNAFQSANGLAVTDEITAEVYKALGL